MRALDDEGAGRPGGNNLELPGRWVLQIEYSTAVLDHFSRFRPSTNTAGIKNIVVMGLVRTGFGGEAISAATIHSSVDVMFFCWFRLPPARLFLRYTPFSAWG